jgi:hypothetical protein
MALRLGKLCGNGADLWLNLQKRYDLEAGLTATRSEDQRHTDAGGGVTRTPRPVAVYVTSINEESLLDEGINDSGRAPRNPAR